MQEANREFDKKVNEMIARAKSTAEKAIITPLFEHLDKSNSPLI
jgi:hypothetical protein